MHIRRKTRRQTGYGVSLSGYAKSHLRGQNIAMKISFADASYIDCQKSASPGKVIISISAKDASNPLKKTNNAVELTAEEFKKLISDCES